MTDEMMVPDDGEDAPIVAVEHVPGPALARAEVEVQVDVAKKYPRSVKRFLAEAISLATIDEETAASCMYTFARGGKTITGPSIRCAEMAISAWGNAHVGARIVGVDDANVVAQGAAWDLEKNLRVTVETRRKITDKHGNRYNEDMITMTGNAAASIALRNAILRIIPRAYIQKVYSAARKVAVGDAETLTDRRAKVLERLNKMGATTDRVLAALGRRGIDDIGLEDLEVLIGLGTAIKAGDKRVDEAFPEVRPPAADVKPEEQGKRMSLKKPRPEPEPEPGASG